MTKSFITQNVKDGSVLFTAYEYAGMASQDPRTRIGAALLIKHHQEPKGITPIVLGANHYPAFRTIPSDLEKKLTKKKNREWKNQTILHAEKDAIQKAKQFGFSLKDSSLYVTDVPCPACTEFIIENKIGEVITHSDILKYTPKDKLKQKINSVEDLLNANINFGFYQGKLGYVSNLYDGITWKP